MTSKPANPALGPIAARRPPQESVLARVPVAGLALILMALAVYLNTAGFDFAYDDFGFIVNNKAIHNGCSPLRRSEFFQASRLF